MAKSKLEINGIALIEKKKKENRPINDNKIILNIKRLILFKRLADQVAVTDHLLKWLIKYGLAYTSILNYRQFV